MTLVQACLALGAVYGLAMGLYGATNRGAEGLLQLVASTAKVPLLFLATLLVTFPSLYVFSALARSTLAVTATLRLLLAAVTINLAVLASFAPITAFFTLSTTSHPFMVLLSVLFLGVAGLIGLAFVTKCLGIALPARAPAEPAAGPTPTHTPSEGATPIPTAPTRTPPAPDPARRVFAAWIVIYGVVGAQMGWILRPFVGNPELPFEWFRSRDSNFFAGVFTLIGRLFQ
ncbi:MAG: hypothetical protein AAF628_14405 [Planctomycetota bacterium]